MNQGWECETDCKDAESINILILSVFINLAGIDLWFIVIFIVTAERG